MMANEIAECEVEVNNIPPTWRQLLKVTSDALESGTPLIISAQYDGIAPHSTTSSEAFRKPRTSPG